eukprot:1151628-Pelagomonas_calceolata.AAC.2
MDSTSCSFHGTHCFSPALPVCFPLHAHCSAVFFKVGSQHSQGTWLQWSFTADRIGSEQGHTFCHRFICASSNFTYAFCLDPC